MGAALYNIFIMPLELFVELVFSTMNIVFKNPGYAIIFVSVAVQILVFPLYKKADIIQDQERLKQKAMEPWVNHIKKTFKGDERFMMLQTYYREVDYKPIYAIKGSISLLLQIPFFMAAYHFLSNLDALNGVSFLGIADLSEPDQLIHIGALTINLLPVLMTFFNIISGIIYTKGFPLKDKIQTYGLACFFLILLYKSPSGLVFYWTLNNLFSLLKNVFLKLIKKPKEVLCAICSFMGIALIAYLLINRNSLSSIKLLVMAAAAVVLVLPMVVLWISKKIKRSSELEENNKNHKTIFFLGNACLLLLIGLLIPSFVVSSSPTEFAAENYGPLGLIFAVACTFTGFTMVWINTFYLLLGDKAKKILTYAVPVLSVCGIITYIGFGRKQGVMSSLFYFDQYPSFSLKIMLVNILAIAIAAFAVIILIRKKPVIMKRALQILIVTVALSSVVNIFSIQKNLKDVNFEQTSEMVDEYEKIIPLSKNGKNVVVIMLDRAISGYVPYIMEEKPELAEQFDGFTYYPNAISFGYSTNYGTPALFGGYEYTPTEINKRDTETLVSKQNEALSVMPVLFANEGYKVTVLDPPYAGYKIPADLSIYDKYDGIDAHNTARRYLKKSDQTLVSEIETKQKHNFVYYSLMKILPVAVQNIVYDGGNYYSSNPVINYGTNFLGTYAVLDGLQELTEIKDSSENTFLMFQNSTTHEPCLLETPGYIPSKNVDNSEQKTKEDGNGNTIVLSNQNHIKHYHTNMASLMRVGEWLDYLKEQGVYDNTRIIIASDHGFGLNQFDYGNLIDGVKLEKCNALFMYKDFNSKGFHSSDEFMTNADTPTYATAGIIKNAVNPFTGKEITNAEKNSGPQMITTSGNLYINKNNGNVFDTSDGEWWSVQSNVFDKNNWKKVEVTQ